MILFKVFHVLHAYAQPLNTRVSLKTALFRVRPLHIFLLQTKLTKALAPVTTITGVPRAPLALRTTSEPRAAAAVRK